MPGFMGLRGLEHKNLRDIEKERREEHEQRSGGQHDLERRSREKVQEILRDQDGDMGSYSARLAANAPCDSVASQKIDKIMSGRVAVLSFDDNLLTVQGIFSSVRFRHLPVVDEVGNIIGIISDRDFLRMASPFFGTINEQSRDKEIMSRKVGVVMTRNPTCVDIGISVIEAVRMMNSKKISCLPVVEKGTRKLLGIVTWKDIVRAFCPDGFDTAHESNRLKTGVHINPESSESARLRAKSAESARLRAQTPESAGASTQRAPGQAADSGRPSIQRTASDTERMERGASSSDHSRLSLSSEPKIEASKKLPQSQRMKPPTEQKL